MHVTTQRDAAAFHRLAPEWKILLEQSPTNGIFLTPQWQTAWWSTLGNRHELLIQEVRDEGGSLLALALLGRGEGEPVRLLGGTDVSDYLDILYMPGTEADTVASILRHLAPEIEHYGMDLHCIREDSPTLKLLPDIARGLGMDVQTKVEDVCPALSLPGSWDSYVSTLDSKDRHELRRKMRRTSREARPLVQVAGRDVPLEQGLEHFVMLHRKSQQEKALFMTPAREAFFRAMAAHLHAAGWLHLSVLLLNGAPGAALLNFRYNNSLLVYNSGFDPDLSSWSPGIIIVAELIQEAIRDGIAVIDFMRGNEPYKYRFGARDNHIYRIMIKGKNAVSV